MHQHSLSKYSFFLWLTNSSEFITIYVDVLQFHINQCGIFNVGVSRCLHNHLILYFLCSHWKWCCCSSSYKRQANNALLLVGEMAINQIANHCWLNCEYCTAGAETIRQLIVTNQSDRMMAIPTLEHSTGQSSYHLAVEHTQVANPAYSYAIQDVRAYLSSIGCMRNSTNGIIIFCQMRQKVPRFV